MDPKLVVALIAGLCSLTVAIITGLITLSVARRRVAADIDLAERRLSIEQKLLQLKAEIDRGVEDRREALDERLTQLRVDLDREKINAEQRQANRRPFLEKQLALCFEATEMASRLATETNPTEWEKARLAFWRLYWGPLSLVEDQAVKEAMEKFGNLVSAIPIPARELPKPQLQQPSYRLAHAARDLVISSWKIRNLPALQGEPTPQDTKFEGPLEVKAEPTKGSTS